MPELILESKDFGIKSIKQESLKNLIYERTSQSLSDLKSDIEGGGNIAIDITKIKDYLSNHSLNLSGDKWEFKNNKNEILSQEYSSITYVMCMQMLLKKRTKGESINGSEGFRVDGIFGPKTKSIIEAYAKNNNIVIKSSDFYRDVIDHLIVNSDIIATSKDKEKDKFGNYINTLKDISKLPNSGWSENVVFHYTIGNILYTFYNNGAVGVNDSGKGKMSKRNKDNSGKIYADNKLLYTPPGGPVIDMKYGFEIAYKGDAIDASGLKKSVEKQTEDFVKLLKNTKSDNGVSLFDVCKSVPIDLLVYNAVGDFGVDGGNAKALIKTKNGMRRYELDIFDFSIEDNLISFKQQIQRYKLDQNITTKTPSIANTTGIRVASPEAIPALNNFKTGEIIIYKESGQTYQFYDNGRVFHVDKKKMGNWSKEDNGTQSQINIVFDNKDTIKLGNNGGTSHNTAPKNTNTQKNTATNSGGNSAKSSVDSNGNTIIKITKESELPSKRSDPKQIYQINKDGHVLEFYSNGKFGDASFANSGTRTKNGDNIVLIYTKGGTIKPKAEINNAATSNLETKVQGITVIYASKDLQDKHTATIEKFGKEVKGRSINKTKISDTMIKQNIAIRIEKEDTSRFGWGSNAGSLKDKVYYYDLSKTVIENATILASRLK